MSKDYANLNWCLYNTDTEQMIDGLAWEQFRSMVKTLRPDDHKNWYYWNDKLENWQALIDFIEEVLETTQGKRIPPLPPQLPPNIDKSGVSKTPVKKSEIDLRTTRRFNKNIPVTVKLGGNNLECETENISIGGAKLKITLPEETRTSFAVNFNAGEKSVNLEAVLIANDSDGARIKFLPTEDLEILRDFLLGI